MAKPLKNKYDCRVRYTSGGVKAITVKRRISLAPFILAAVTAALLAPLIVMLEVRTDAELAEWWTVNIAQGFEHAVGVLTSWLPFSIFEFFVVVLICAGLYLFYRLVANLCGARFKRILVGFLALAAGAVYILNLYIISMGFGYYRSEMPLKQAGADYNAHQTVTVAQYFLDDYNYLAKKFERDENGCVICPYTFYELARLLAKEYDRADEEYFFSYTPYAKPIVNSWLLSDMLITGITFLPTGEANVNNAAPPTTVTYTMAHELAHAKGVQREGDANLISYYIMLSSYDDYLRYCGYYATFYRFVEAVKLAGDDQSYYRLINSVTLESYNEHIYTNDYWDSQPDILGEIAEFFNNMYLMFNGADNGTDSYQDGTQGGTVTPIDPDTGDPVVDPDTGEPVIIPVYSELQKEYFYIYEQKFGVPATE